MEIHPSAVPAKVRQVSFHIVGLVPYPTLAEFVQLMAAQDPKVTFGAMTPLSDEVWNFVDGKRTVTEILESVCLEFDFDFDPQLLMPFIEACYRTQLITLNGEVHTPDQPEPGAGDNRIDV